MKTISVINTQFGNYQIITEENKLLSLDMTNNPASPSEKLSSLEKKAVAQLNEYFSGLRRQFELPIKMIGTEFQKDVWKALFFIPYGETVSYCDIAAMAGHPAAIRAAGTALGKNPLPIIVPCHRVIRKNNDIGNYTGGVDIKKKLLKLEKSGS